MMAGKITDRFFLSRYIRLWVIIISCYYQNNFDFPAVSSNNSTKVYTKTEMGGGAVYAILDHHRVL